MFFILYDTDWYQYFLSSPLDMSLFFYLSFNSAPRLPTGEIT